MYKAAVRLMIKRNIARANSGDFSSTMKMFAKDATLSFPGDNSWSNMFRPTQVGREAFVTHRGKDELKRFLQRYVDEKIQMVVDDILVNGPPWNTRVAIRVHHWVIGVDGTDVYTNRAVLFVSTRWGKIISQEDYEDTERIAAYDQSLNLSFNPSITRPNAS
jgi:ketosteroid isomerase-like protein